MIVTLTIVLFFASVASRPSTHRQACYHWYSREQCADVSPRGCARRASKSLARQQRRAIRYVHRRRHLRVCRCVLAHMCAIVPLERHNAVLYNYSASDVCDQRLQADHLDPSGLFHFYLVAVSPVSLR